MRGRIEFVESARKRMFRGLGIINVKPRSAARVTVESVKSDKRVVSNPVMRFVTRA